jgi:pimeloyl-ACP methyl ester carboxylesterase
VTQSQTIRDFPISIPEHAIEDLKSRLRNTRWPEAETVDDWTQGVPLAWLRDVCDYWADGYDWRRVEAELNETGSHVLSIEGFDIHFLHQRSSDPDATPLLMTHGWPGSVIEFLDVIPRLTNPAAFGLAGQPAFHVVAPALPGYGFSTRPAAVGVGVEKIISLWARLMDQLGYDRYIAQGGDWGSEVSLGLAQANPACIGAHVNFLVAQPPGPVLADPTADEARSVAASAEVYRSGMGYAQLQSTRPQTLGYGLTDSPVGQAAWILEKFYFWTDNSGDPRDTIRIDRLLDNVSLYWFTATAASSARLYWESAARFGAETITAPVACSVFPAELFRPSRRWAESRLRTLVSWSEPPRGGHFAAMEQPGLFADEVRQASAMLGART